MATMRVVCPWCGEVERPKDLWAAAAATPVRVSRALRGLTEADRSRRPLPVEWSLREIVAHLADIEVALGYRLRKLLAEESPEIQPFDEKAWAERLAYDRRDLPTLLQTFRVLRAANLDLLRQLPPAAWERVGHHPQVGPITALQTFGHILDNDLNHLRQVAWTRSVIEGKAAPGV